MISYWEQQSLLHYDYIVIGAGIVGLSSAIEIKERWPDAAVLVLERSLLPAGASTRNAGFACMGSATELLDDLGHVGEDEVINLFERRKKGLDRLRMRLHDTQIGYRANGSYELIAKDELYALDKIDYLNKLLLPITGKAAFRLANDKINTFGFARTQAIIENTCEGELHSGMLIKALLSLCGARGVVIMTGADAVKFEEAENSVTVQVQDPFRKEMLLLQARRLCICTNAFTRQLLPEEEITPGRGQVLITRPVPGLRFKGIFHFDKGYYYFREIDGCVLLGGGRNLDFEGETTTDFSLNEQIQLDLENKLGEIILPGQPFQVAQRWAGIMAFGNAKRPVVKAISAGVFGAFKMSGMGVALASEVAKEVVDLMEV